MSDLSNSTMINGTHPASQAPSSSPLLGILILSLATAVGFPGNVFIIWTIMARMSKRTVTCILILHLAVADTAVILTAPLFIHLLATGAWYFGSILCKTCHYICCLSMYASIFLISFMSLDRFLVIYKPVLSHKVRTKAVVMAILLVIWLFAFLFAIPMPFYRVIIFSYERPVCRPFHSSSRHVVFQYLFETLFGFLLPFTVILGSYVYIGLRLRSASLQHTRKTACLIALIVIAFAVFWLPYHVVNVIQVLGNLMSGSAGTSLRIAAANARPNVTALAFLSSSINPILYAFIASSFIKSAGVGFMAKLFEGTSSEVSGATKHPQNLSGKRNKGDPMELERMNMEVDTQSKSFSSSPAE
ncbi:leukotriene B4 receptor 1-like [Ambystoma mexicanum]|uniref:leukotriene B4 receptor 1-like n=1 Tax=Ambystoma mexicanum TaxID=8296 RepID=UPI0037E78BBB